ncbi:MAG TPA: anhydro-N-acetylmuramic acid kinase [Gemmatimonadaceae bacterium]|nr:anhydro-N-acetylmuramic acid kinase [Gemmatimonadaceae bacterium]
MAAPVILIGLMSGTSADGISAAAVRFTPSAAPLTPSAAPLAPSAERRAPSPEPRAPSAELLHFLTLDYTPEQRDRLLRAAESGTAAEYARLNYELGAWLAVAARAVIEGAKLAPRDVRAIASHGHTLWHAAPHDTWQAGESAVIAERTGLPVISDFRARDVAAGGQGAPLVAIADRMLFAHPARPRALQNLGGIANVSLVPPAGAGEVSAFDTGPGCAVIDGVVRTLVPSLPYDLDGALASRGAPVAAALEESLADPFFAEAPPKSTGRERFSRDYIARFIARCRAADPGARIEDIVATSVALTARSIAAAYDRFLPADIGDVLLSGGGARNPALVRAIRDALAPRTVRLFSEEFFRDDAKEAVAFALLGWLFLEGRPGNIPHATGAAGARILGKLTPA